MTIKGSSTSFQVSPVDYVFVVPVFSLQSWEHCARTHLVQSLSLPNTSTLLHGITYLILIYCRPVSAV